MRSHNAELADAVHDQARFQQAWDAMVRQAEEGEAEKQREIARLNEDPFNVEAQAKIEEIIRQQAVQENLQHAFDYTPEGEHHLRSPNIPSNLQDLLRSEEG